MKQTDAECAVTCVPPNEFVGNLTWQCHVPDCNEEIEFVNAEGDVIAFLVVHHLVQQHGWTRAEVLAFDEGLAEAAKEYRGFPRGKAQAATNASL